MGEKRQFLHWVFKTPNLKKSLEFYALFGMKILRHEEFNSGCEASCNGKYARPWSKTMVGFGSERDSFVLELTYNYGVRKYTPGNDLAEIGIIDPTGEIAARVGAEPGTGPHAGTATATAPCGHTFRIIPAT
eukprot:TRINITY_DN727_c0_g2_i1.p1 TRINITY_DN727_c0_g2~~TRINITY_DN727_c0_g2_i1.p1  ORF type:complete len:132 (-),score=2.25 TRINITY_DN727_c0_g2_i1:59-454(-)